MSELKTAAQHVLSSKIFSLAVFGVIVFTTISYFAITTSPKPISYNCENGEKFVLEVVNRSQIQIISGTQDPIVLSQESKLDASVAVYGNEESALTFVNGYGEQAIKTSRRGEPLSTICNPL